MESCGTQALTGDTCATKTSHPEPLEAVHYWPSQHLLVQSQQWKHQKNVRNLFKVDNKDTRTTSMTSF